MCIDVLHDDGGPVSADQQAEYTGDWPDAWIRAPERTPDHEWWDRERGLGDGRDDRDVERASTERERINV